MSQQTVTNVTSAGAPPLETLEGIQRRVLWLAMRMIDYANRERPNPDAVKVGGHQASSASVVSLMTAHVLPLADVPATASRSSRTRRPSCTPSTTCWGASTAST